MALVKLQSCCDLILRVVLPTDKRRLWNRNEQRLLLYLANCGPKAQHERFVGARTQLDYLC